MTMDPNRWVGTEEIFGVPSLRRPDAPKSSPRPTRSSHRSSSVRYQTRLVSPPVADSTRDARSSSLEPLPSGMAARCTSEDPGSVHPEAISSAACWAAVSEG